MPDLPPVAQDVLTQARAYADDPTASDDPQSLVAGLLSVLDLIDPCPHIVTSGEGSSFCDLAESRTRRLLAEVQNLREGVASRRRATQAAKRTARKEQQNAAALAELNADLELHNEGLARQVGFMERYRMRATRYGLASERLLDVLDRLIVTDPEGENGPGLKLLDATVTELRQLLADPPTPEHHHYVSTACQHGLHDRCRLRCKFCETGCACGCGHPSGDSE